MSTDKNAAGTAAGAGAAIRIESLEEARRWSDDARRRRFRLPRPTLSGIAKLAVALFIVGEIAAMIVLTHRDDASFQRSSERAESLADHKHVLEPSLPISNGELRFLPAARGGDGGAAKKSQKGDKARRRSQGTPPKTRSRPRRPAASEPSSSGSGTTSAGGTSSGSTASSGTPSGATTSTQGSGAGSTQGSGPTTGSSGSGTSSGTSGGGSSGSGSGGSTGGGGAGP